GECPSSHARRRSGLTILLVVDLHATPLRAWNGLMQNFATTTAHPEPHAQSPTSTPSIPDGRLVAQPADVRPTPTFRQSARLRDVRYDVRGPILTEAMRLEAEGH